MTADIEANKASAAEIDNVKTLADSAEHAEGNAFLVDKHGAVRRVPVPSNNPNDPLNFKPWEKWAVIVTCCWFCNYIILPVSLAYGRRPVFLVSSVILLAFTIGSAVSNSYEAHLATRIVQGFATGASESLLPLMITEVTFLHERGKIFGLYWTAQTILGSCFALASSYEVAALGWRSYYWVFAIAIALGLALTIFLYGVTRIIADDEAQEYFEQHGAETVSDDDNAPKLSYGQMLKPWSKPHPTPWKVMVGSWVHMLQSLTSPAILFAVLSSSAVLGLVVCISLTYDAVLQAYGWAAKDIGLINVASIIGGLLGSAYCTLLGEPFVLWMAKRNHGIHKPEHRLIVLVPMAILGAAMLLVYGFGAERGMNGTGGSFWTPLLGWAFFQTAWISVLIVTTTFASEASPKHPGPALVMVVGTKNIVSFGVAYAMTPMVEKGGYSWTFGVLTGVYGAIFLLGIPVYFLNPKWRQYMAKREQKKGITTSD
ncbi:unnamed protein product [Parascedosporium putredinis]|uniref:Major facilitator superfamily (MFS) profile domain-containing protein n=1 Tax=Parascedosporium putredinis TaxID=1442378 RepID=A0A9P1MEC3_9PEZI|nr:unnamed protein product [Parascedosporium putredinis]CAI8004336.1 unnamed protein product [Parascedosporium putredinis]